MKIKSIEINNFRSLKESSLLLSENESWLIGKNNTGKTSFLILFDYFYNKNYYRFDYNDFTKSLRSIILGLDENTDVHQLSIRLLLEINYSYDDDLSDISEFITDLSEEQTSVKIALEAIIDKKKLLKNLDEVNSEEKDNYIKRNLNNFINVEVNIFNDKDDLKAENRERLIKKDIDTVKKLINFQLINAKRDISSSEERNNTKNILSALTTRYFNSQNELSKDKTLEIEKAISKIDKDLDDKYTEFFGPFLKHANTFLDMSDIRVESDLKSQSLLSNMSKVVYGTEEDSLPEYLNGLGYMNILYLLLNIEISKQKFAEEKKGINLLCIEEPEAHTHPQMQYIFAREISKILCEIPNLQTLITSHSSHMISQCNFANLKYFKFYKGEIKVVNFEEKMLELYETDDEKELYKFLKKYLSIQSAELFFADKVIFIEGISERILINYFLKLHDCKIIDYIEKWKMDSCNEGKETSTEILEMESQLLLSQNITILEVGANAKAFKKFIDFLGVKTLIITDIDSIDKNNKKISVSEGVFTSNATIKDYCLGNNILNDEDKKKWFENLLKNPINQVSENIKIAYQTEYKGYCARSFEDSFINCNMELINKYKKSLEGLKNIDNIDESKILRISSGEISLYDFVYGKRDENEKLIKGLEGIIDIQSKSNFSSSIYFIALKDDLKWNVPNYIEEGLVWIAK